MFNKYPIRDDFKAVCEMMAPVLANDQEAFQEIIEQGYEAWNKNASDDELKVTKFSIPSFDSVMIDVQLTEAQAVSLEPRPCLIYFHGGGFVFPALSFHFGLIREYVLGSGCKVVCVNYRVDPDAFPTPLYDCYHTLLWVKDNADKLGINPERIALGGDSAGGLFTAAAALMARDKNGPKIVGQMLIYPVMDARMQTESMKNFTDTPVWNAVITDMVWKLFLKNGDQGMRMYASPMEADSFSGLPQAYIEVAEYDCLRDEGINYAEALKEAGVLVELHKTKDTVHAFDYIPGSEIIKDSLERRNRFLKHIFS